MRGGESDTLQNSVTPHKKPRKLAAEELFEFAVKLLTLRGHSTGELRTKLGRKAASRGDVDVAIARLNDVGYLDDKRYAESYASARVENEGFGRMRVLQDLRTRRISGKLAEQAVDQALEGRSESELIDAYIDRKMSSLVAAGPIEDEKKLATAYRRLRRAGFTSGGILAALKRKAASPELVNDAPEEEETDPEANPGE